MIKTKIFNNIKNPPKFKRDEVKVFKYYGLKEDPLNPGKVQMPFMVIAPNKDRVYDPDIEDYVDIAAIKSLGIEGKPTFHTIEFTKQKAGRLLLQGNIARDRDLYQFLTLSNYNASNPNRDTSVQPLFELVNPKVKAEKARKSRSLKRDAMNVAAELSGAEVREFISSLGKDEKRDLSVLRDELETLAETDPNQFIKLSKNTNKSYQANIKRALDKNIISFDGETNTFTWTSTGETIVQVPRSSKLGHLEGFTNFVLSNKNGASIYQEIVKLLK
ncbi:MAG: hypothetical protein CMI60_16130 [Parvibaculum sp.]|nr:hypothetical protein [Parvibaculum sp.]